MSKFTIYTAGVVEGDWAGVCARLISSEGKLICEHSLRLPAATDEEAVYDSILFGVRIVNALNILGLIEVDELVIYSDNKKITQQISRNSCCENAGLASLLHSIDIELDKLPYFEIKFISKRNNNIANAIATDTATNNVCIRKYYLQRNNQYCL